jgi:hypothetical protein
MEKYFDPRNAPIKEAGKTAKQKLQQLDAARKGR